MRTAQDFIRRLLEVDARSRMSLVDALRHPWLDSSTESAGDESQPSALARDTVDRSLSDASELSKLPEGYDHAGANGDASTHLKKHVPAFRSNDARISSRGRSSSQPSRSACIRVDVD